MASFSILSGRGGQRYISLVQRVADRITLSTALIHQFVQERRTGKRGQRYISFVQRVADRITLITALIHQFVQERKTRYISYRKRGLESEDIFGRTFSFFEGYEQIHQTDEGSTLAARVFSRGSCLRMLFFTLLHSDKILPHVHNDFV